MSRLSPRVLLALAGVVFAAAIVTAVVQPGELGDDDVETAATTTTSAPAPTTSLAVTTTSTEVPPTTAPVSTTAPDTGGTSGTGSGGTGTGTGSSGSGSGIGGSGTPSVGGLEDGLPNTGHQSLVALAAVLAAAGVVSSRLRPRHG